jgi:hypothetical protein
MTAEYSAKLAADRLGESSKTVNNWLNAIRRNDFTGQEAEFDVLADRARAGDFGEGKVALSDTTAIFPVVDEMRQLYKTKHGRVPAPANYKALQLWLDSIAYQRSHQDASATHVPQTMKTDYLTEAEGLQQDKKGKRYWDTPREMFARAFDAYVADKLQERAAKNSYLAGLEIAPPKGEERKAINAAFDVLVGEIKTRKTERGVWVDYAAISKAGERPADCSLESFQDWIKRADAFLESPEVPFEAAWAQADGDRATAPEEA